MSLISRPAHAINRYNSRDSFFNNPYSSNLLSRVPFSHIPASFPPLDVYFPIPPDLQPGTNFVAPTDIYESPSEYTIEAEVQGFKPDELTVQVRGRSLVIKGIHRYHNSRDIAGTHRERRGRRRFVRSLHLPEDVDETKISAVLNNGLLNVNVPKHGLSASDSAGSLGAIAIPIEQM